MFKIAPGTKEQMLSYIERHNLTDLVPMIVASHTDTSFESYEWNLAFIEPERVKGYESEVIYNVDGIDFVIDCLESYKDDLRKRTMIAKGGRFVFEVLD